MEEGPAPACGAGAPAHLLLEMMTCMFCEEPILPGEEVGPLSRGQAHLECEVRNVVGSAAHQLGECSCFGGDRHDPPGMSRRDCARLAYEAFRLLRQKDEQDSP